ncbi:hypothetical protein C8Q76DRAFT_721731 [Earliella scabrosa]|nr:hypothetical protein C8Q76DRAFT_721731 [Earliella scabrosa]
MNHRLLEDILQPCLTWSSSTHLAVDEIHKAPIFRKSLTAVHSDYGRPTFGFFKELISTATEYSRRLSASSCAIITRPPEIIACFCITDAPADLYVIFDSHPRPEKHPHGAAFIFKNSIEATAEYLTNLLRYDKDLLADNTVQWQAQLLAHVSGDVFVANDAIRSDAQWADAALDASLQALGLQAHVCELESKNQNLEENTKRLNDEVSDLDDKLLQLEDELKRLKRQRESRRKTNGTTGHRTPLRAGPSTCPIDTRISRHASQSTVDGNTIDPFAAQLQWDFDEENRQLERQYQYLQVTQPTFFDCGVCLERYQEDFVARVMPCDHVYCRPCLQGWVVSKIEEHRYPILCPTCTVDEARKSDPSEIDNMLVQQLGLTDKQYDVFSEMQLAPFSTIIHCRKCTHTIFVDKAEYQATKIIVCPLPGCCYAWCKICSQEVEVGGPQHSCDGSSELNHLMKARGWKYCPGCQTPAEKIDGCNYISCTSPGCNTHFCYHCGELAVRSVIRQEIQSAKAAHYTKCKIR